MAELFYYLHEVANASDATLAGLAALVFGAVFLAALVQRALGSRALIVVCGGVALARLLEQINVIPAIDLIIASIGLALFLLFIPISLKTLRTLGASKYFALSMLLGWSIDTTLKGAFGTIDLAWLPGWLPLAIVVALIGIQLGLIRFVTAVPNGDTDRQQFAWAALPLLAVGPLLFLQAQLFQNIGVVTTITNFPQPAALEFILVGNAIGIVVAETIFGRLPRRAWTWTVVVGLILIVVVLPIEGDPLAVLELLAGQVAASIGLVLVSEGRMPRNSERDVTPIVIGISLVLMFGLLLGYYLGQVVRLPLPAWTFAPMAALMILLGMVGAVRGSGDPQPARRIDWTAGMASLALVIVPFVALFSWHEPAALTGTYPVRIMSYNLHSGFDVTGRLDLEAIAQTIEAEKPDVIALQEVSRGWVLDGSVDMLVWLSQRLNLPYVWGPTADPIWGNAILSRYPIDQVALYTMPNNAEVLPMRGYLAATIDVDDRPLHVIATHLHHVGNDGALRVPQVKAILDTWAKRPATVIVGDMNATPDSAEMKLLRDAGLVDSFASAGSGDGFTFVSYDPDRRIDYIYLTADLSPQDFHVNPSTASDHRAIAVTIK